MFNKDDKRAEAVQSNTSNIISRGTIMEGNIKTPGNLRIEGRGTRVEGFDPVK